LNCIVGLSLSLTAYAAVERVVINGSHARAINGISRQAYDKRPVLKWCGIDGQQHAAVDTAAGGCGCCKESSVRASGYRTRLFRLTEARTLVQVFSFCQSFVGVDGVDGRQRRRRYGIVECSLQQIQSTIMYYSSGNLRVCRHHCRLADAHVLKQTNTLNERMD